MFCKTTNLLFYLCTNIFFLCLDFQAQFLALAKFLNNEFYTCYRCDLILLELWFDREISSQIFLIIRYWFYSLSLYLIFIFVSLFHNPLYILSYFHFFGPSFSFYSPHTTSSLSCPLPPFLVWPTLMCHTTRTSIL